MYRKITRSKKCSSKKNNIRNNIRATYAKSCINNVTNASCKVTKVMKNNDAKNNKNSIRPSYVKYSRKGIYITKSYTNIHSKYINQGKRYRLQRCVRYIYMEPVLRQADSHTHTHTHTHKHTAKCTVSSSKQSDTEKKQETPVLYVRAHNAYSKLTFVGIGIRLIKSNTQNRKGNVIGNIYAVLKQEGGDSTWVMGGTGLSGGKWKKCDRTVSGDYGYLSVHSKMEAKQEEGPEMDVDGATPEGQNGKKLNILSSCKPSLTGLSYVIVPIKRKCLIVIPLYCILKFPLILILVIPSYLCNSVRSLAVILFDMFYTSSLLSPHIEYIKRSGVHTNFFRHNRYRE
jgi:hypothetical protein